MFSKNDKACAQAEGSVVSIQQVLEEFSRYNNLQRCSLALLNQELRFAQVVASSDSSVSSQWTLDLAKYPELRQVMQTGYPLAVRDVKQSPIMAEVVHHLDGQEFQALKIFPVIVGSKVVGALVLRYFESDPEPTKDEYFLCQMITTLLACLLKNIAPLTREQFALEQDNHSLRTLLAQRNVFMLQALATLKTPVAVIHGFSSLMKESGQHNLSDDQRECLKKIIDTCDGLDSFMTDILDLMRILCGKTCFELAERDLNVVVCKVCEEMRGTASEKGLTLQWDVHHQACPAWFDASTIQRVLEGLLVNALRFTPFGGKVWVRVEDQGTEVHVHVQDTGIGIDGLTLKQLLGDCTLETAFNEESSCGLGLTLYRAVLDEHGGRMWAVSRPGEGSTFSFSLPKAAPALH